MLPLGRDSVKDLASVFRYGAQPSRASVPEKSAPSTDAASSKPRPGMIAYTVTSTLANTHSQARSPSTFQPVSSGETTCAF